MPKAEIGAASGSDLLTRLGRYWFRWRSFSPLPFLVLFVFLPAEIAWKPGAVWGLLALVVAGETLRLWAVGFAGSVTRTRGDRVPRLIHAGPYRWVRNPLYIGNFFLYVGCGFLFGFLWLTVAFGFYTILQYFLITEYEESLLATTFGAEYENYRVRVSRWIPSLSPQIESTPQEFNLLRALKSEKSTLVALAGIALLWFLKYGR